jgi:hypothetical protein
VHPVDVKKARRNEAIILLVDLDLFYTEFITLVEVAIVESFPGYKTISKDEDKANG